MASFLQHGNGTLIPDRSPVVVDALEGSKLPADSGSRFSFTQRQSASNKTPRRINRNLVFNLIRTHQPLSRADIARLSGLQRSTVSLIVEDLIHDGWILEGSIGRLPRGRRPTYVQLNEHRAVIALDIHPAQTTMAVTTLGGTIVAQTSLVLPAASTRVIGAIIQAVESMVAENGDYVFDGIGISVPGRLDPSLPSPTFAPRLNWPVRSLKEHLERATGLRVELDNVANACVLSEVWFGQSDGLQDMVVVNVSEGIATGIFLNGRLLRGKGGMAGEFGHVQVQRDGTLCACGATGCWESFASNRAGLRYYQEISGGLPPHSFEALVLLAQAGDPYAVAAISKMSVALGSGLRMIASALAPSEIVVVGEITAAWNLFGPTIEEEMKRNALSLLPRLRPALDGGTARLRSAVALVMNEGDI
jgi:predicted NBD/HSP70 family sugar kinase